MERRGRQDDGFGIRVLEGRPLLGDPGPVGLDEADPLGAEVELVADGAACVEAWKRGAYDSVLMDIHMPVMDGVEAARIIRTLEVSEDRKRIPIVAVTANALVHQVEGYLAAGMDGHVAKPIEVTKLYDAIETAVAAARREGSKVAAA